MATAVQSSAAGDAQTRRGRRHHSLPRQLLRAFEASPARGHVQSGLATRMEPFEAAAVAPAPGVAGRPYRAWWSSTIELSSSVTNQQQQQQQLHHRALYGADIPEPLSSYERHVRSTIDRHRRRRASGSNGSNGEDSWMPQPEPNGLQQWHSSSQSHSAALRRYATLADLSDLEAAAAEVERRVNNDDSPPHEVELRRWSLKPTRPPPPPPPPRPRWRRPPQRLSQPPPQSSAQPQPPPPSAQPQPPPPLPSTWNFSRQRFTALDSFEAMKRTIERQSAATDAAAAATAAAMEAALERTRWLLDVATSGDTSKAGLPTSWRPTSAQPPPPSQPPPVPLRRNRRRLVDVPDGPGFSGRWSLGPHQPHSYGYGNGHNYFGFNVVNAGNGYGYMHRHMNGHGNDHGFDHNYRYSQGNSAVYDHGNVYVYGRLNPNGYGHENGYADYRSLESNKQKQQWSAPGPPEASRRSGSSSRHQTVGKESVV